MSAKDNKSATESELSSIELRSKLFHTFKSKGVLQSVKTQLRNRLALELQNKFVINGKTDDTKTALDNSLFLQVSNSLVVDHLKRCCYDYTLSVFITECLTNPEKVLSVKDILHLLQIHPESILHKKLVDLSEKNTQQDSNGFLYSFLQILSDQRSHDARESSSQTDDNIFQPLTLDAKLEEVERMMNKKNREDKSIEERLLNYQRKYEAQKKTELKAEIERFKSSQLSLMRIEERDKYQKEIEGIKNKYDENYKKKMAEIERKEIELERRTSKQKELMESESYGHRQKILSDLEQLKEREIQMEKNHNIATRTLEMEEDKLRLRNEQLKYKEDAIKDIEKRYEERLQNEIIKVKFELQQEGRLHSENLQMQEQQLKDDKANFDAQRNVYLRWKTESEKLKEQNEQQHISLLTAKQTIQTLNQKLELLSEKYRRMDNYDEIVNLNKLLERDIAVLQKNFDTLNIEKAQRENEHQKLVKELLNKISRSNELDMVQAKDQENKERYFREKYYSMQDKYQLEVSKNEELKKLNEDLLLSQRETLREVDELRAALQTANLENQKYVRMKNAANKLSFIPSAVNWRSKPKHSKFHIPTTALINNKRNVNLGHDDDYDNIQPEAENGSDVLAKLEREAMELEKSYMDFQERQKEQLKGSSRVHFNPLVHHRSTSTFDTTDQTRTLEIRASDESIKQLQRQQEQRYHQIINATTLQPAEHGESTVVSAIPDVDNQQPLSSTQTPGQSETSAPSFGISRVTKSTFYQDPPSSRSNNESSLVSTSHAAPSHSPNTASVVASKPAASAFGTTCYSLTQHPLGEATATTSATTMTVGSPPQYPLYDTHNTLTQYPLVESGVHSTSVGRDTRVTFHPEESKTDNSDKPDNSLVPELAKERSMSHDINDHVENRTNSVENDGLKETSIATFESPLKVHKQVTETPEGNKSDDIFYTPATHLKRASTEEFDLPSKENTEGQNAGEDSISSKDDGSMKSNDLKTDPSEMSQIKDTASLPGDEKPEEEKEENDLMAKYMKMVLEKKQTVNKIDDTEDVKNEMKVDDIPLSEDLDHGQSSSRTTSEYEW